MDGSAAPPSNTTGEAQQSKEGAVASCTEERDDTPSRSSSESDTCSEKDWKPVNEERASRMAELLANNPSPRELIAQLHPSMDLPSDVPDDILWRLIISLLTEPPKREKLSEYNTLDDAVDLIAKAQRIVVLTGAGISVSCGIPDFRSKDGIYARLHEEFPDLPDPQSMFEIGFFRKNPKPFFHFAKDIYPGEIEPSFTHKFLAALERSGKLLRNYTQNIDCLETQAGLTRVVQCHGSFATAKCCSCGNRVDSEAIHADIKSGVVPLCPICPETAEFRVMKPDIVFFGESLGETFHNAVKEDKDQIDLLIVIGSSMKVGPVNFIPNSIDHSIPQILINRDALEHLNFDISLLGHCDQVTKDLAHRLKAKMPDIFDHMVQNYEPAKFVEKPPPLKSDPESDRISNAATRGDESGSNRSNSSMERIDEQKSDEPPTSEASESTAPGPSDTGLTRQQVEELRHMYSPRRYNLASCLAAQTYTFVYPAFTIFDTAEFLMDYETEPSEMGSAEDSRSTSQL